MSSIGCMHASTDQIHSMRFICRLLPLSLYARSPSASCPHSLTPWQANSEAKRQLSPSPPFYSISSYHFIHSLFLGYLIPIRITLVPLSCRSPYLFFRNPCFLSFVLSAPCCSFSRDLSLSSSSSLHLSFWLGDAPDLAPRSPEPEPPPWSRSP